MRVSAPSQTIQKLVVVMPTWLGDCVMATPTLRALRELYPQASITALTGAAVQPILAPSPWIDAFITTTKRDRPLKLARRLAAERFDMAVLLPNSFRAAAVTATARIPRRVGYQRDGRGVLLTDRLVPMRSSHGYVPVPTRDYYLALARYLGAVDPDPTMELFTRSEDDAAADQLLARAGYAADDQRQLVLLNPGANYGDAKMWMPDRFASLADLLADRLGAVVAVSGAPKERAILDRVIESAKSPIIDLPALGLNLTLLKSVVHRASLMVTNDTGPRHIAAALGTPVITVFGPTDPAWTVIGFDGERIARVDVDCGPCQLKRCPLDHKCMKLVTPEMVAQYAADLWPRVGERA